MPDDHALRQSFGFKSLKFIMYAMLLTPLWFWSIFLFPFITTKIFYLRLLIELALVIYIYLAFRYPQMRPSWNWLNKTVVLYFLIVIITSFIGVNIGKSFMGTIERGEGVVTMLHFLAYFFILPLVFRTKRDWKRYLIAASSVISFVALYGLGQLLNLPFVIGAGGTRISGTIGNAAFFAGFVMFAIFLNLHLLKSYALKKSTQYFLWALIIINLIAIYNSQTRGTILALGVAAVIYTIYLIFRGQTKKVKLAAVAALAIIILSTVGIYAGKDSKLVQSQDTLRRIATISATDITTQSRFDTWGASWQGFQDRFFTGFGYENYNIAFNKYFPARIFKDQGSQIWFDRAHNIFFDVSITSGIFGLAAYLGIFTVAGIFLIKVSFKRRESGQEGTEPEPALTQSGAVFLGLGLIAYFIQNLFVFDTQATYLIFFLILGYISYLITQAESGTERVTERKTYRLGFLPIGAIAVGMFFVAFFVNFQPAFSNIRTVEAIIAARTGQFRQVQPSFEQALSHGTYMDEEIRQRLVDFANEAVASGQLTDQEQKEIYDYTLAELDKSIAGAPLDVRNYLFATTIINRAERFDESLLDQGRELAEQALELSPTRPQTYFELGQLAFSAGNIDEALGFFQTAIDLNPEPKESHLNLVLASIFAGRPDITERELQIIADLGHALTVPDYESIVRAYSRVGDNQGIIQTYLAALTITPNSPELHARAAAAYGQMCDLEGARRHVDAATTLSPGFAVEGRVFLQDLENQCSQ